MKKILKICGIIVGALLIAVLAAALIFPGVPQYLYVKNNCININVNSADYPYYDTEPPEKFTKSDADGFTLKLPRNMYYDADAGIYTDGKADGTLLYVSEPDTETNQKLFSFDDFPDVPAGVWDEFFADMDGETPETMYDFLNMAYKLDMSDIDIHSRKKSKAFSAFAQLKERIGMFYSDIYNFETENYVGFVCIMKKSDDEPYVQWMIDLFPKEDKNSDRIIMIQSVDTELIKQIIALIE